MTGGPRKIVKVSEITGMEGDVLCMHDVFEFTQTGLDENRAAQGYFCATGIRPLCLKRMESSGADIAADRCESANHDHRD